MNAWTNDVVENGTLKNTHTPFPLSLSLWKLEGWTPHLQEETQSQYPLPTPISGPGRLKVFFQDCWLQPGTPNCTQRHKGWEGFSCRKLCLQVWGNSYQHHGSLSKKEDWWSKVLNKDSQQSLTRKGCHMKTLSNAVPHSWKKTFKSAPPQDYHICFKSD